MKRFLSSIIVKLFALQKKMNKITCLQWISKPFSIKYYYFSFTQVIIKSHECIKRFFFRYHFQAKIANYCRDIFGDMLLDKPIESHPLLPNVELPPPSLLKRKIIIKNKKKHHHHHHHHHKQGGSSTPNNSTLNNSNIGAGKYK